MTIAEINKTYNQVNSLVFSKNIKGAFDLLSKLIEESKQGVFFDAFEKHQETYKNILQHSFTEVKDPEKEYIYDRLRSAILDLTALVRQKLLEVRSGVSFYTDKQALNTAHSSVKEEMISQIEKKMLNKEWEEIISDESTAITEQERKYFVDELFRIIWLTDQFQEQDNRLIEDVIATNSLYWHEKCIMVSALTLSVQRFFDVDKIMLMVDLCQRGEQQVWQRALVGLILVIYQYDQRLNLHRELLHRIEALTDDPDFIKKLELVLFQLIRSRETGRINQKLKEEILPEVQKLKPRIEQKLNLDNIITDTGEEEKNPEWESFFEDSPELFKKLEEISKLQLEGSDVFMGAFSMLKRFSFFDKIQNWFLPFYEGNETARNILGNKQDFPNAEKFTEALSKAPFLCNSDKYSFCLNVQQIPAAQRSQMADLFKMEMEGMNELANEDEKVSPHLKDKYIIAQYVQDLYRFHKVYALKNEFYSVFETNLELYNKQNILVLLKDKTILRNIGEFYFEKGFYDEAIDVFKDTLNKEKGNKEIIEKIAYSYQQKYDFEHALNYYLQVEVIETNKPWIIKKIGFCYRKLGNHKKALEYYRQAEKLEPDNLYVQTYIGHCYLDLEQYNKALNYYFKVEYQDPSNIRIMRPIGWCSFILGKFENASKYFGKLIDNKSQNKYDLMNLGHVEWCTGNSDKAIELYMKSIEQKGNDFKHFSRDFNDDSVHLIKHGIDKIDIPLMLDNLKYKLKN